MTIEAQDGFPVPPKRTGGASAAKYPLATMDINQSFFAPGMKARSLTGSFPRHKPRKFVARALTENGVDGARVWRVE